MPLFIVFDHHLVHEVPNYQLGTLDTCTGAPDFGDGRVSPQLKRKLNN